MIHDFGEKTEEFSVKQNKKLRVWQSPKYEQSRKKAIEIIEKYDNIGDGDFWILMNETKNGSMAYTGLIISHNACLKINDHLESKFVPSCVTLDKSGYNESLVYTYCNDDQGIYEVGEVSKGNCKNAYPYAMAYKRLFDRVVLKLSKLAYDGVYSDSEADEFKEQPDETKAVIPKQEKSDREPTVIPTAADKEKPAVEKQLIQIESICKKEAVPAQFIAKQWGADNLDGLTMTQAYTTITQFDKFVNQYQQGLPFK